MRQRRFGAFLLIISEQENCEVERLDLCLHLDYLQLFSTQSGQ
jgi:hypothetical protein